MRYVFRLISPYYYAYDKHNWGLAKESFNGLSYISYYSSNSTSSTPVFREALDTPEKLLVLTPGLAVREL